MHPLFSLTSHQTLAQKIRGLHDSALADIFTRTILTRGRDYVGEFDDVDIEPGKVTAEVCGSEMYELTLEYRSGDVFGGCTCPYEGRCKHLAALLIYLRDMDSKDLDNINPTTGTNIAIGKTSFDFDKYLENLSAEELRILVRQFAPESYRRSLAAQHTSPSANQKALQADAKKVRDLLKHADRYGPSDFEETLVKALHRLRPFWLSEREVMVKLLGDCLKGIDDAQNEGYLYDDYGDGVFEGDDLGKYLAEFTAAQSAENLLSVLQKLAEAFGNLDFSFSENFLPDLMPLLSEAKTRAAVPFFLHSQVVAALEDRHQRVIWQYLQPVLSADERRRILENLSGKDFFVLELSNHFELEKQPENAIAALEKALPKTSSGAERLLLFSGYDFSEKWKLFERRIELEHRYKGGRKIEKWSRRYIQEIATAGSVHLAVKYLPERQADFEKILRENNMENFAAYLEDLKRLDEVHALFQLKTGAPGEQWQYDFFKRHKKTFPAEAKKLFQKILEQNLPNTGDRAYTAVTEALTHLKWSNLRRIFKPGFRASGSITSAGPI